VTGYDVLALSAPDLSDVPRGIAAIVLYALLGLVLMVLAFYVIDWTTPGKLRDFVRGGYPNAALITGSGLIAMALVVVVAIWHSYGDLGQGLATTAIYGVVGIVVQAAAVRFLELVVNINIGDSLKREVFTSEAWVVAAAHLAIGLVVAVSIS